MDIYISLVDKESGRQLVVDGDSELFKRFLSMPLVLPARKIKGSISTPATREKIDSFWHTEASQVLNDYLENGENKVKIVKACRRAYCGDEFDGTLQGLVSLVKNQHLSNVGKLRRKLILAAVAQYEKDSPLQEPE